MSDILILAIGFVVGGAAVLFWRWCNGMEPFSRNAAPSEGGRDGT